MGRASTCYNSRAFLGRAGLKAVPDIDFTKPIALFPVPNCVLLPRAILPLHIFEPRYKTMIADALDSTGLVAMAILKPGYEEKYYTSHAAIREIACVGSIVRHEQLSDGRYNILLQGVTRAHVEREDHALDYRRAFLTPLAVTNVPTSTREAEIRHRLLRMLETPLLIEVARQTHLDEVVKSPDLPLTDAIDFLAGTIGGDIDCCVRFLEERDVVKRCEMLVSRLQDLAARVSAKKASPCASTRPWPRSTPSN